MKRYRSVALRWSKQMYVKPNLYNLDRLNKLKYRFLQCFKNSKISQSNTYVFSF